MGATEPAIDTEYNRIHGLYQAIAIKLISEKDVFYSTEDEVLEDDVGNIEMDDNGSTSSQLSSWNWHHSDDKEIIKLEKELLTFQMETAMLERKRIEELMAEEALEREARATERALRLRAARLDAVAAAAKLPSSHPAARFTPEEARAAQHLSQYQQL
ncbi:hypothetical protein NE865_10153 [Phthorimaea operculella]|nr:hypothetical protein NE865_10153 [Phthorimaea operculella]